MSTKENGYFDKEYKYSRFFAEFICFCPKGRSSPGGTSTKECGEQRSMLFSDAFLLLWCGNIHQMMI